MPHTVAERARRWSRELRDPDGSELPDYIEIHGSIHYLAEKLYAQYVPTQGATHRGFPFRLRDWLDSAVTEDDQKVLFRTVPRVFFVGRAEFDSLYKTAFNGPVARWLLDLLGLGLDGPAVQGDLWQAISRTCFCAISDSMEIGAFHRINNIQGADVRPELRSFLRLGGSADRPAKAAELANYMARRNPPLERIVLLEDFVGSGAESLEVVEFAAELPGNPPVLFCPVLICPTGGLVARELANCYANLTYRPVLELPDEVFLMRAAQQDEPPLFPLLREVVERLHPIVAGSDPNHLYGPYGFDPTNERAALVVLFSNCPDNTLPIIHHTSDGPWEALFPRTSRL